MSQVPVHATAARRLESPVGELVLLASAKGLAGLFFGHRINAAEVPGDDASNQVLEAAEKQLGEYFAGVRTGFNVTLDTRGTPFGVTRSYAEIARRIGKPKSVRAVGAANGSNPVSIIVPCHRVIGMDGSLTGFGGGLDIKRALLESEGVLLAVGE